MERLNGVALFAISAVFTIFLNQKSKNIKLKDKGQITDLSTTRDADCDSCSKLCGTAKVYDKHVIICDATEWPKIIEEDQGRVACEFNQILTSIKKSNLSSLKIKLTGLDIMISRCHL